MQVGRLLKAWLIVLGTGLASQTASAAFLSYTALFTEQKGPSSRPDLLSLANDALSTENIEFATLDLSTSAGGAFFNLSAAPFSVVGPNDVGFDGTFALTGVDLLVLHFTDFQPGETFVFGVDVADIGGGNTKGTEFAGSLIDVDYFDVSPIVQAVYVSTGNQTAMAAAPEPDSLLLTAFGLVALGLRRRPHARARL